MALLALSLTTGSAQVNNPEYADYLLVGRFGEICTMCEAIVICEQSTAPLATEAVPATGSFTLYNLQTRTFWSQIATIREWFLASFASESLARAGHTRPAHVFRVVQDDWQPMEVQEAHLSLDPAIITIGARAIDRVDRRWLTAAERQPIGYCRRLPLWESLAVIENRAPKDSQQ